MQVEQAIEAYNAAKIELDADPGRTRREQAPPRAREGELPQGAEDAPGPARSRCTRTARPRRSRCCSAPQPERLPRPRRHREPRVEAGPRASCSEIQAARKRDAEARGRAAEGAEAPGGASSPSSPRSKASIQSQLAERQRCSRSIKSEIARSRRPRRKRQARLRELAEQRLQNTPSGRRPSGRGPTTFIDGAAPDPPRTAAWSGSRCSYLGVPYVWGGASPSGFDCSGLVMYVYAQVGVSLPHNAAMQYGYGSPVSRATARARRPRLLQRARPRRDLHRRRPVHPRAAHRRRREDLEPQRLVVREHVLRRPPHVALAGGKRSDAQNVSVRTSRYTSAAMRTIWNGSINFGLVNIPIGLRRRAAAQGRLVPHAAPRVRHADQAEALVPGARARGRARRARQGLGVREGPVRDRRGVRPRGGRAARARSRSRSTGSSRSPRSTRSTSTARTTSRPPTPRRSAGRTRCCSRR